MRVLLTGLVLIAGVAAARAQEPEDLSGVKDPHRIRTLISSRLPVEAAWGSFLAGREQVREAVPDLARLLAPEPERDSREWQFVRLAALDALILLDARLPGETLHRLSGGKCWRRAIILLARQPEENREQIRDLFLRYRGPEMWLSTVALGNLLAGLRDEPFVENLLGRIEMSLSITVTLPDRGISGGAGGACGGRGDGHVRLPEGFPPYAHYYFWEGHRKGATPISDGPHPVCYTRRLFRSNALITGIDTWRRKTTLCALEWLADLLDATVDEIAWDRKASVFLYWKDAETYLARAVAARGEALAPWRALVERTVVAGLLTSERAARIRPKLAVSVRDDRGEGSEPLPKLPDLR
jgi:hypothetical protein